MSMIGIKACTFSAVSGIITFDGEPAANARVLRRANWQKEQRDQTTTDNQGRFEFPAMLDRSVMRYLNGRFTSIETLEVEYNGQRYMIWKMSKTSSEENSEFNGKPMELSCELNAEPEIRFIGRHGVDGLCVWEGME